MNKADQATNLDEKAGQAAQKGAETVTDTAGNIAQEADSRTRLDEKAGETVDQASQYARNPEQAARDAVAGADSLVGQKDEQLARAADRTARRADHYAGSTDEALGKAGQELSEHDIAGAADEAAGGMDEAVGQVAANQDNTYADKYLNTEETRETTAQNADALAGRTDEYVGGAEMDREVTDSLTQSGGFLPEEDGGPLGISEKDLKESSENIKRHKKTFDENEPVTFMGSNIPERVLQGAADASVDILNVPGHARKLETATEVVQNTPTTVQEEGGGAVAETTTAVVRKTSEAMVRDATQNPVRFASGGVLSYVTGAGVARAIDKIPEAYRSGRTLQKADSRTKLEDVTSEKGVKGENPTFDTNPNAPTEQAVKEVRERAADNPREIAPGDSESTIFHTTTSKMRGRVDVGEGGSELPGLWGSPDASPLGLEFGSGRTLPRPADLLNPRVPGTGRKSDQVVALPGDDVRGMPDDAQGSGYELRTENGEIVERGLSRGEAKSRAADMDGVEVRPDSSTRGHEFLQEQAQEGALYVRPAGSRTPELEGIYPPGSEFVQEGMTAVEMPDGRVIPGPRFTRADAPDAPEQIPDGAPDAPDAVGERYTPSELPTSTVTNRNPGEAAAFGGYVGGGGSIFDVRTGSPRGGQPSDPFGSVEQDIQDVFGLGRRVTSGDNDRTSQPESPGDNGPSDTRPDGRRVPSDDELPDGWRRKKPDEYGSGNRPKDRDDQPRDYGDSSRRDYGDRDRSRTGYPDDSGGSTRVSDSDRRVTGGGGSGSSPPGGSDPTSPPSGSDPTSPPTYDPPEIYPPPETYGQPRYGTSTPPSGPAEYTGGSTGGGIPYSPIYNDPFRPRSDVDDDGEQDKDPNMWQMGYFGKGWVNPVADAQQATAAVLGGSGDYGLGAVEEDLQSLR